MADQIKFGTDGWRAIIAKDFTCHNVARLTAGLATWIKKQDLPQRVVVGADCRFGGELFSRTVAAVLLDQEIEVLLCDRIVTTPMLSLATRDRECAVGVMITASHNSPDYNGFKLKNHLGGPMGGQALIDIESATPDIVARTVYDKLDEQIELLHSVDIESDYIQAIEKTFDTTSIKKNSSEFAYDAMYGSGQFVMKKLFPGFSHFRAEYNPSFHGLSPEPIARNLGDFADFLKSNDDLQLGLVTDGDADRIGLMNGRGEFIDSHHIILLLIHYLCKYKGRRGKVVTAFSTVSKVEKLCQHYGLEFQVVKIGFKYASKVMINEPVMIAGEESGGIAVDTHLPERDGIWMGLMLMECMASTGKALDELIKEVYDLVGSFRFIRNDLRLSESKKQEAIEKCKAGHFKSFGNYTVSSIQDMDGWKFILSEDAWVLIRPSGTEPVLRVYVEAPEDTGAQSIMDTVVKLLV